jgi:DNA modification methylase
MSSIEVIGNATLYLGDCLDVMATMPADSIDLTVTSPPYDSLRTYNGYTFDFEGIARELYRVTKPGGVVVWIVGDATVKGSETGTSFRQALYFKDVCGFNLHDTMIWNKRGFSAVGALVSRYAPVHEYMFVLSKGKPWAFNPIKDRPNIHAGSALHGTLRNADGTTKAASNKGRVIADMGQRFNVWEISPQRQRGEGRHPAPFPEQIAADHIASELIFSTWPRRIVLIRLLAMPHSFAACTPFNPFISTWLLIARARAPRKAVELL